MVDQRQPQFAFIHSAIGQTKFEQDRLQQRLAGIEPAAGQQGDEKSAAELLGQHLTQNRLAAAGRTNRQADALGPIDASGQRLARGFNGGGREIAPRRGAAANGRSLSPNEVSYMSMGFLWRLPGRRLSQYYANIGIGTFHLPYVGARGGRLHLALSAVALACQFSPLRFASRVRGRSRI